LRARRMLGARVAALRARLHVHSVANLTALALSGSTMAITATFNSGDGDGVEPAAAVDALG